VRATCRSISRVLMIFLALAMMLVFAISTSAQDAAGANRKPVVQDWGTHHVVFSHPGTATDAIRAGNYERWLKIVTDPRYIMQQQRRSLHAADPAAMRSRVTGLAVQTRAESDSDIDASDAAAGASEMTLEERQAAQRGNRNLPTGLSRALIPPTEPALAPSFAPIGVGPPKNRMKKDWSEDMGSGGSVGLGDFPATYTTGTNCSTDFAVFNTGLTASGSQASIIAYRNLYTSCTPTSPTTYWANNTGGTIINGVDLSPDGSQVAFVQSNGSGVASLVLLKWASGGTLTSPVTPTSVSNANYRSSCTPLPCMTTITLSGSPSDTYSFPYYDYGSDTIYVGDDGGALHKFTNIFRSGNPAEATSPWPVTVFPTTAGMSALGSPVYDSVSGKVFIGDYLLNSFSNCEPSANAVTATCGYLYSVTSSGTTVVKSHELDYNIGILDSPIVDSSAEMVYVFVGDDGSTSCAPLAASPCAGVFQFSVGFAAGASGTEAKVGPGYEFMMSGTFDNAFFNNGTGHLYVVGNTGPANNTLYQIPITSGTMGTSATAGPVVSTNYTNSYYAAGLQISEIFNASHDYIFLSVLSYGSPATVAACGTTLSVSIGCILGFDVTGGTISGSTAPTGGLPEAGGTSGIVVDNAAAGASNIYFSTLLDQSCTGGTGGCAIQTLQSAP
jgi:hypothetical protein